MPRRTTVRSSPSKSDALRSANPDGLLLFAPLGRDGAMRYIALTGAEVTIGRDDDCRVHIDDTEASRVHAKVQPLGMSWLLVDLESTNGLFVNGHRVSTHPLMGGEVIRVGSSFFRFFHPGLWSVDRGWVPSPGPMVAGPAFDELRTLLDRAARSDLSVLVTGETGTGKELVACHLHESGDRLGGPFIPVNCSAIPAQLIESELFGHAKGAFTGASVSRQGLIQQASRGTLFLDEIGEMPLESQAKLLRVLQERQVRPVGSTQTQDVDIRVVSATNLDLEKQVKVGEFRADLFARLAELEVHLPPLRHRREDIPALVAYFLARHDDQKRSVSVDAMEQLCCRRWPYNIRELENTVRRALVLAGSAEELEPLHFAEKVTSKTATIPPADAASPSTDAHDGVPRIATTSRRERRLAEGLIAALERHKGDASRAAEELGISRSQVYRRAKKLGVRVTDFRE